MSHGKMSANKYQSIRNRIKLCKNLRFKPNVCISIFLQESERLHCDDTYVMGVYFLLTCGEERFTVETDTVMHWRDLPRLASNKAWWSEVGALMIGDINPNTAYLLVASKVLRKKWRYDAEYNHELGVDLHITKGWPETTMIARVPLDRVEDFFIVKDDK